MPQDRSKTAPSGQRAPQGGPPKKLTSEEHLCIWLSRLFASDGHQKPQDGPKVAREGSKRGA
eukprot:7751914-Pyramimonas_sp.AAC.1